MFISSNTHPPAKRCHALMKLFGLPAPVAKELCVSCFFLFFFFLPADSCHQIMIRDEHTSRCSSQWRVHSELDWQTAPGRWTRRWKKNTSLCAEELFFFSQLWPPFLKATPMASRLNAIGDASMFAFLKAGWPGIRRAVELHGWAFCSSVPLARCRCKPVSTTTTPLSQRLAIVIVNFRRRFLSSPLFFDVWFLLPFIFFKSTHQHTGALRHRWHEKSLRSGVSWICLHVGAFHREIIPHSLQKKRFIFSCEMTSGGSMFDLICATSR